MHVLPYVPLHFNSTRDHQLCLKYIPSPLYSLLNSMHVDSHRLRFRIDSNRTSNMPCPQRFQAALQETVTTEDGVKMYTWRAVRRQHLRMLRKQTRTIVFFMALIEALRVGVVDIVYAGHNGTKAPGPEDYGVCWQRPMLESVC